MRISSIYITTMLRRFESEGIPAHVFLNAGIKIRTVERDRWFGYEKLAELWQVALQYRNDPHLGLHIGEKFDPAQIGVVGYLIQSCENVGTAFIKMTQYNNLVGDFVDYTSEHQGDQIRINFAINPLIVNKDMEKHIIESEIAATSVSLRHLTKRDIFPSAVTFAFPAPDDVSEYERVFNCPVIFGQHTNTISIRCDYLELPVTTGNAELAALLERHAEELLVESNDLKSCVHRVQRIVAAKIKSGQIPTIEDVAEHLNLSVRTLQRKLKAEHATYQKVVENLLFDLAKRYLKISDLTITEIAYLLGYSDPSIFTRTFKRKSGLTPGIFRSFENKASLN